jgi:hypothetical protein
MCWCWQKLHQGTSSSFNITSLQKTRKHIQLDGNYLQFRFLPLERELGPQADACKYTTTTTTTTTTTLGPLPGLAAIANTRWCRTKHCTTKT